MKRLTTADLRNKKFDQMHNFQSHWKFEIFNHCRSAKQAIWSNAEIWVTLKISPKLKSFWPLQTWKMRNFSYIKKMTQIWHFWPPRTCETRNLIKCRNLSHTENMTQVYKFLTAADLWNDKIWSNAEIRVTLEIWPKFHILDHLRNKKFDQMQKPESH